MNSKKIVKIITVLLIIATIISSVNMVLAFSDLAEQPVASGGGISSIESPVGNIMGVVQYICYAAAVILLVLLGVKFMTASPEGQAEIKKSAIIYVVGAVLVFAAGVILGIIKQFGQGVIGQ